MKYGLVVDYIEKDGFKINAKVYNVLEGDSISNSVKTTIGNN